MLSPKELADKLGISVRTVYNWRYSGKIPFYKVGKAIKFKEEEINDWLEKRRNGVK